MSKWYRLDNAAKIFPPAKSKNDPRIFRFAVSLKEDVDCNILEKSLLKTIDEYPIFKSTLKKGLFWYYLEETNIKPIVEIENSKPCEEIKNGLLFRITYYHKRINLEVDHALTDGTGAIMFLKSLIAYYLDLKHNLKSTEVINTGSLKEKREDAFSKYKNGKIKKSLTNTKLAYKIKDDKYLESNLKIIEGIVDVEKVKKVAKNLNLTITEYITTILIKSIGNTLTNKEHKKPIVIAIPVNLRNFYPSHTVRNFFSAVNIKYDYHDENLDFIAKEVKKEFAKNLDEKNIENKMNSLATLEDIFIIKFIPIFIKDIILKIIYRLTNKYQTMTLSNIGIITMPKIYEKYLDCFSVFISTDNIQLCMCSYNSKMVLSFSSQFVNSEVERYFFRYLTNEGIEVNINTNVGDYHE